jgi:hypothetical protein
MLEIFFEHYKSSLKILLIFYIYFLIVIYIFYGQIKEHLLSNWKYYREHPLILPISGFIKKDEGLGAVKTTVNNFIRVLTKIITKFLNIFMKPIYPVLEIIIKALNTIKNVLEGMRKQINVMRNFMFKLFEKMYIRLQNGVAAITYFFLKLREGLKRSFGLFTLMIYSVEHSYMFFESLVRSPMGKFGKFAADLGYSAALFTFGPWGQQTWANAFCFSPNTILKLDNNSKIKIKDIEVGQKLINNNIVLAKLTVNCEDSYIYSINNILVSGSHLVKYKQDWIRVEDHPDSKKVTYNDNRIICLITSLGVIKVKNFIFKDYLDDHETCSYVRHFVEDFLNNNKVKKSKKCKNLIFGIHKNSCSNISNNNNILGIIEVKNEELDLYKINNNILSGNILIKKNNLWYRVSELDESEYIGKNREKCYHYVTDNEILILNNGDTIRDFSECRNSYLNDVIDKFVEINLKK